MRKKLLFVFISLLGFFGSSQDCPQLLNPLPNATNVPVTTTISWQVVEGVPAYIVRLGTTPEGSEIVELTVGTSSTYTPAFTLPDNTTIYVTIILDFLFLNSEKVICETWSFSTEDVTTPPACSLISAPENGDLEVSIFSNVFWNYAPTAAGYLLSMGTDPNATNIQNELDVGNRLNYVPENEFPENSTIYIQVTPYNENGRAADCTIISFTTGELPPLPNCTNLTTPRNGSLNVPLNSILQWNEVEGADGYKVTIGTRSNTPNITDNIPYSSTSISVFDFIPNQTYFMTIVPFNEGGDAIGCIEESFSTAIGCGPFLDAETDELVDYSPNLDFPDRHTICSNQENIVLKAPNDVDGYRWYEIDEIGEEVLLAESPDLRVDNTGNYKLEVYNLISIFNQSIECSESKLFSVVASETPKIIGFDEQKKNNLFEITVLTSERGDYKYAIDDVEGPYQDSNIFIIEDNLTHTYYVLDNNGCGIAIEDYGPNLILEGFPKFFTPNGDNTNDFWQFMQPFEGDTIILKSIEIFDRYGNFLTQINQNSAGWDGTFNGQPLTDGGYWFKAINSSNKVFRGNFTLKR
ncbi:MAG: T9SS type B sorting domain-containing protein [Maribacter sp.]